ERVLAAARTLPPEAVPLAEAVGRPLAERIVAPHALPPFRNSAMDGIAVRSADVAGASPAAPLPLVVGEALPGGRVAGRALRPGEAARIMTGAMLPEGADAVIPVEDLTFVSAGPGASGGEQARVSHPVRPGENVRDAGLDLAQGATALEAGRAVT